MKRIIAIVFMLCCLLMSMAAVAEGNPSVIDDAGLFTTAEISQMETMISKIRTAYQIDAVILTSRLPRMSDSQLEDYADRYFEDHGYGCGQDRAGMLYLIDMGNRFQHISTAGVMIDYLNQSRIEKLLDAAEPGLQNRNYGSAVIALLKRMEKFMADGIQEGHFRYDRDTGERLTGIYNRLTYSEALFSILLGAVASALVITGVISAYSLKRSTYHFNKLTQSSVQITNEHEHFLRRTVTRVHNPPPGSGGGSGGSGGGSAVHISSGGMSHGGGGRHF